MNKVYEELEAFIKKINSDLSIPDGTSIPVEGSFLFGVMLPALDDVAAEPAPFSEPVKLSSFSNAVIYHGEAEDEQAK